MRSDEKYGLSLTATGIVTVSFTSFHDSGKCCSTSRPSSSRGRNIVVFSSRRRAGVLHLFAKRVPNHPGNTVQTAMIGIAHSSLAFDPGRGISSGPRL